MGLAAPRSTPFQPPPATPLALASTLRATASAPPLPCPQRAVPYPSEWTLESGAACRAKRIRKRASKSRQRLRNCALEWASGPDAPDLLGEGEGSREKRRSRTFDRKETFARSSPTRQAARCPTLDNSPRKPAQCDALGAKGEAASFSTSNTRPVVRKSRDALGRRAAAGVPDSRAEAKGLGSAERDERPVRGRRHLVVKSQVMRRNSQKRESAASS